METMSSLDFSNTKRGFASELPNRDDAISMNLPNSQNANSTRFMKAKDEYELKDFKIVVKLGKGAFGNVYLVELDPRLNRAPNSAGVPMVFAMKVIDKTSIFT